MLNRAEVSVLLRPQNKNQIHVSHLYEYYPAPGKPAENLNINAITLPLPQVGANKLLRVTLIVEVVEEA